VPHRFLPPEIPRRNGYARVFIPGLPTQKRVRHASSGQIRPAPDPAAAGQAYPFLRQTSRYAEVGTPLRPAAGDESSAEVGTGRAIAPPSVNLWPEPRAGQHAETGTRSGTAVWPAKICTQALAFNVWQAYNGNSCSVWFHRLGTDAAEMGTAHRKPRVFLNAEMGTVGRKQPRIRLSQNQVRRRNGYAAVN